MRKICVILAFLMVFSSVAFAQTYYTADILGDLSVEVINDGQDLAITYSIYNNTPDLIIPSGNDVYPVSIRSVYEPEEFINVEMDAVSQAAVSQYALPYTNSVLAVKIVPVPEEMQSKPGIYLAFLSCASPYALGEEIVFHYPGHGTSSPGIAILKKESKK